MQQKIKISQQLKKTQEKPHVDKCCMFYNQNWLANYNFAVVKSFIILFQFVFKFFAKNCPY